MTKSAIFIVVPPNAPLCYRDACSINSSSDYTRSVTFAAIAGGMAVARIIRPILPIR
jgi:hypothetical protein